jgi:hypothetical protein
VKKYATKENEGWGRKILLMRMRERKLYDTDENEGGHTP